MNTPLISCIVPVYNGEKYLADAIGSILGQTYKHIELIVADDGSTDKSCMIAESYGKQLNLIIQETEGPAATRNFGLRAARGDFISFLDADDIWHPEKLAKQIRTFRHHPNIDFCVTHVKMFWENHLIDEENYYRNQFRACSIPGYATTTLLARKSVFDQVGTFNNKFWFSDAVDWFVRANEMGLSSMVLPKILVYHRMHSENLTRRCEKESRDEYLQLVKAHLDRLRAKS